MTDTTSGPTRPFRFGIVAPFLSDLPTWREQVRRIADQGEPPRVRWRLPTLRR
jgi:hypothetical protein